jgi:DNA repair protein SbcC/Rad50
MIKSIHIQNFQSHEKSQLDFDPGVNIIIGTSDSGKTAIIRALRWVVWNRPSGNSFRSNWGGDTSVEVYTNEGSVLRSKSKSDKYIIKTRGRKDLELEAFSTSVPPEVNDLLGINEVNLQMQLDRPFLLDDTPGDVAKHFNKVARLDKIDSSQQYIQSEINTISSAIGKEAVKDKSATGLIKQIEDFTQDLSKYNHLEKAEFDLEVLENMEIRRNISANRSNKLLTLIGDLYEIKEEILINSKVLVYEEAVNAILADYETRAEKDQEAVKLDRLICFIKQVKEDLIQAGLIVIYENTVNELIKLYAEKETQNTNQIKLSKAIRLISDINRQMINKKALQESLQSQFEREMGEVCLLCGSEKKYHKY